MLHLAALALRPLVSATCRALGLESGAEVGGAVAHFLQERFVNHSARLTEAMRRANERAWKTLEFALAGDSLVDVVARADDRAFREQVRGFLAAVRVEYPTECPADFRGRCLQELRGARRAGQLGLGTVDVCVLMREAGRFAEFASPSDVLDAERRILERIPESLAGGHYPHLVRLLGVRPRNGTPLLVASVRYFFRREIVADEALFRELTFARLDTLREEQEEGFAHLEDALEKNGELLEKSLGQLEGRLTAISDQIEELTSKVNNLLESRQLSRRPVAPGDSLSLRDEGERRFIQTLIAQYRGLPPAQRQQWPELLNGIAKLQMVSGAFDSAGRDFKEVASLATDSEMKAEACYNAYQAAQEQKDWAAALQQLTEACKLNPSRFAPFPLDKYRPLRILGVGGFGAAFLCQDEDLGKEVVVKALLTDNLERDSESFFQEARLLNQVSHPAVVKLINCDYADRSSHSRPYLVMDYFESTSLAEQVRKNGPLPVQDLLEIMRPVAQALETAHEQGVLHRDVKPANVLVRRDTTGWQVRLIDFGLALKQGAARAASVAQGAAERSLAGAAIAGTLEYASPEQMGRISGERVGFPSDVYGFAKTCCYALFGTTQPLRRHWTELPAPLADLLERALSENPHERPQSFGAVLRELTEERGKEGDGSQGRILQHYLGRLSATISRSPVLKVSITRTGRLLDVTRLATVDPGLPAKVIDTIIDRGPKLSLDLRWPGGQATLPNGDAAEETGKLYDLLDRKIRRDAELARRENGVHALWLGYPLLYATPRAGADRCILSPLFLWPLVIEADPRLERHLRVGRAADPDAPRFNRIMATWIRREMGFAIEAPEEEELAALDGLSLTNYLGRLAAQFPASGLIGAGTPLERVPDRDALQAEAGSRLVHSAALGYFRWQNESILADLEAIRDASERGEARGVVRGFISTKPLARPVEVRPPAEEERFLVTDADFSQERVVWQARNGPGLVTHGPPGTGKSQTIVNVIADTLSRGQTVLMVCQKQAATRVVMERLRAAGLADLCLEVHDADDDRKAVFQAIRGQVESLPQARSSHLEQERQALSRQIAALEKDLDSHARAFHQRQPDVGLSYRDMKDREQQALQAFPTAGPIAALQRIVTGLSAETVDDVCRRAGEVGRWYAAGQPLTSPWRFARFDSIRPSLALRQDVSSCLDRLRAQDAEHQQLIREGGLGLPLPPSLAGFEEAAPEVLARLRPLAASSSAVLHWLPGVRRASQPQRQELFRQCQEAVALAEDVERTPLDSRWHNIAARVAGFRSLAGLIAQIEKLHTPNTLEERLAVCWLRTIRQAGESAVQEHQLRCRYVESTIQQAMTRPVSAAWAEVDSRVPDFPALVAPILQHLEAVANGSATTRLIVGKCLKALQGVSEERIQATRARCRKAMELARSAAGARLEPRWTQASAESPKWADVAPQLLERLQSLRAVPASGLAKLTRGWLQALRRADEAELQKSFAECQRAAQLARSLAALPQEAAWDAACGGRTILELEVLQTHAREVLRRPKGFLRLFSGAYRRARTALLELRPDASDDALPAVAEGLIRYMSARQTREQLLACNRALLPEHAPCADESAQQAFPRLAGESLEQAAWLLRVERQHNFFSALLDEYLWHTEGAGPLEKGLRAHLAAQSVGKQLEEANQNLVAGLKPSRSDLKGQIQFSEAVSRGLDEAIALVRQEHSSPWIAPLLEEIVHGVGASPSSAIQELKDYLECRQMREHIVGLHRDLVPGYAPPGGAPLPLEFATTARQALERAAELQKLQATYSWVSPLLDELLAGPRQNALTLEGLKGYLQGLQLRERLAGKVAALVPGLQPDKEEAAQVRFARDAASALQEACWLCDLVGQQPWVGPLLDALLAPGGQTELARRLAALEQSLRRSRLVRSMGETFQELHPYLKKEGLAPIYQRAKAGETVAAWIEQLDKGLDGLPALLSLEMDRHDRSGPAGEVLKALEEYERARAAGIRLPAPRGQLDADQQGQWWAALVSCSAAVAWQARCQEKYPELNRMTPEVHSSKVRQLGELLGRKRQLEAEVIRERWLVRQQQFRDEAWNRMFQERSTKQGTGKRLREAVELSWDKGLPALRPCWLVNPGAASQIFPLEPGLFDLVIFDEASQCPVEQAIPTIYRGKRLLVSGDEKQLPPTAFFAAGLELDNGDLEEAEADDNPAEAIRRRQRRAEEEALMNAPDLLDASIGKLKQLYLCVHYRSDHPALIEFSNRAFYKGQLEAPPARCSSVAGSRPIEYLAANGCYTERTNQEEARQVVALLRMQWLDRPTGPTIGVVTFNQAQRDLIEDLIEQECQKDSAFSSRYQEERDRREGSQDVGFFVKNLENIQGDERDVVIFSTTFGPDPQGRFYRRFGPVGMEGGHRRLNVAVTRAKRQVFIVSSMPIPQIANSLAGGSVAALPPAGYLQLYLEYARAISARDDRASRLILDRLSPAQDGKGQRTTAQTALEADVCKELQRLGYQVEPGIGETGFRIDLAVIHPDPARGYILGIDCDGGSWLPDRSARLREVWRASVLRQRGWKLHQIWSSRWWTNKEEEILRLRAALEEKRPALVSALSER